MPEVLIWICSVSAFRQAAGGTFPLRGGGGSTANGGAMEGRFWKTSDGGRTWTKELVLEMTLRTAWGWASDVSCLRIFSRPADDDA